MKTHKKLAPTQEQIREKIEGGIVTFIMFHYIGRNGFITEEPKERVGSISKRRIDISFATDVDKKEIGLDDERVWIKISSLSYREVYHIADNEYELETIQVFEEVETSPVSFVLYVPAQNITEIN